MTTTTKLFTVPAAMAATTVLAFSAAGVASANPSVANIGETQRLQDGAVVSAYTVEELEPSDDHVDVPVAGQLWEADVTVEAVQGTVTPAIPFFNVRADTGENYRVLYQAMGEESLNGATLQQGGEADGNLYFDVTGAEPAQVVYNDAVQDRLVWNAADGD